MMKNTEMFKPYGFDKPLFFITLALLIIGFLMVFSSSAVLSSDKYHSPFHFLINQVIGAAFGIGLIFFIVTVKKPLYQNPYFVYGLLLLTFILLVLCFAMPAVARTNRWIQFFGIRFQPSEVAKISLVIFLGYYLEAKKEKVHEIQVLIFPLLTLLIFILLIIKEPDYGTALLLFVLCAILLFIGGVKLRYLACLGLVSGIIFTVFLFQASYRIERLAGFMSPEKDPLGKSFQIIQSKLAVGTGGLLGVSIGESTQKLFFLPCAHTDFIFAIIGEEFGLIGTLAILTLFFLFLWRGLSISARAPSLSSQLVATGLTLAICSQALLNISVALGLGPAKGVPLPLISFGRSSLICTLAAIGIILNISQRKAPSGLKI